MATTDAEGEHTATHTVAVLLEGDVSVGVGVQAGVVDGNDMRRSLEGVTDGGSVVGRLASAQVQSLQTTVGEPRVEGGGNGANGVLKEAKALLELVAVESGDAHDNVAVAVDVLGDAVDDNVSAQVEGVLNIRRQEGVVDNDEDTVLVGFGDNGTDVDKSQGRVARAFNPDEASLLVDVLADIYLDFRSKGHLHAVGLSNLGEVAVGATVHVRDGDDMTAGSEALEDVCRRGTAAGEGKSISGVLESSNGSLKVGSVGVGRTRVFILANRLAHSRLRKRCR